MAKILFIQNHPFDLFGVETLAGYLSAHGHRSSVIISNFSGPMKKTIAAFSPSVVAFPCFTGQHNWVLHVSKKLKDWNSELSVLVGGIHPTFFPEIIEHKQIDFVCRGEGEYPVRGLLDFFEGKRELHSINGISYKTGDQVHHNPVEDLIADLDTLPFPDRSIYYNRYPQLKNSPMKYFLSSRGCPYKCSFCCNVTYTELYKGKGRWVRQKSVEYFIDEIKDVRSKYPLKSLRIDDEIFILNREWTERFLERYRKEIGLPFWINVYANLLNEGIVLKLKEAGCHYVSFSLETGNERFRRDLLNKQVSNNEFIAAAKSVHNIGLPFSVNNIMGLPGETLDYAFETLTVCRQMKPTSMVCSLFQPYPSAPLYDYSVNNGFIAVEDLEKLDLNWHSHSIIKQPNIRQLENLHKLFHLAVYFPRLEPIIKKLIQLPPNPLFMLVQRISHLITYKRTTGLSLRRALWVGIKTQVSFSISKLLSYNS